MSGILNNFMANLQPIQAGGFNPVLDSKYADLGGLEMLNQSRDAIARSKVEDMIRQAQSEGRDLNQYEAGLISRVSPNATAGYNNNLTTQSTLKSNEMTQASKKQELENQWISDTARILKNSDPAIKNDVYKAQIKKAMDMGIQDETDPQEYSPEIENQLVKYSEAMIQEQKDARSYGSPAPLQLQREYQRLIDSGQIEQANQLAEFAKTGIKGTKRDENGKIIPQQGVLETTEQLKNAEQRGMIPTYSIKAGIDVDKANQIDRNKSLPPAVQKQIKETTDIINATNRSVDRGIELYDKIDNGTLNLGFARNAINNAKNGLGVSTEESRSLNELQTYVNELANNVQLMAKGTQTDKDASRAKDIILSGTADEGIVKERLAYLIKTNADLVQEQELALETQYRQNNKSPDAYKSQPQTTQQPQQSNQDFNVDDLVNKYGGM